MKITNVDKTVLENIKEKYATRIKLWHETQKIAIAVLEKSHQTYTKDFKYNILSPFTFKAPDFENFCSGVLGYGRITKVYSDSSFIKTVLSDVEGDIKFMYCLYTGKEKYELPYRQNRAISVASKFTDIIYFNTLDDVDFYKMVISNFDKGLVSFEDSDLKCLTRWDSEINEMKQYIDNYKDLM